MSNNEKPLDLDAIEARLKAITPGEWHYWSPGEEERFRVDIEGRWIAFKVWDENDAQFIANAPADIAALLQRVEELEAKLTEAKRTQVKFTGRGQLRPFPEVEE